MGPRFLVRQRSIPSSGSYRWHWALQAGSRANRRDLGVTEPERQLPTILDRLACGEVLVSDGATGTYLQDHGLRPGGCPEEFNASHPEVVKGMALAFLEAGADMVDTNSFGGNRFRLGMYGYGNRVRELNLLAARHARSQTPADRYVVGSVGPTGELLEPLGEVGEAEVFDGFVEQITALFEGGIDAITVQTMTSLEEAVLAVRAAKETTGLAVIATMAFEKTPRGFSTMMGVTPEAAVRGLQGAGADVVGANCGNSMKVMIELARKLRQITDGYLLIHSNAGTPAVKHGRVVYPDSPESMARDSLVLADIGINIVGGCCGTGPDYIRALVKARRG